MKSRNERISQPIFIVGVPRSGTTLLRILLDSHPNISCGPESPWLARGSHSIKNLYRYMAEDPLGYVASYKVSQDDFRRQFAVWVDGLFMSYATKHGKSRWAEKTPDHSLEIPFLADFFPDAYFVHIVRDGRDVSCSTAILSDERKRISDWHANYLLMEDGRIASNNVENAAVRWQTWLRRIEKDLALVRHSYRLRYEDLVADPEQELKSLMEYVGEGYSPLMLDYMKQRHDFPDWEWGSRDVKRSIGVSMRSVRRWEKQLDKLAISTVNLLIGQTLDNYGYEMAGGDADLERTNQAPERFCSVGSVSELETDKFSNFMSAMNHFAEQRGLRTFDDWSKVWEYPWLWFNLMRQIDWAGKKVLDLGSEISPMPWLLASLGASVTLVECDAEWISKWEQLKADTGLDINWKVVENEELPFPDMSYDVVTSLSVLEHQADKEKAVDEVNRVLKNGGLFALSFDICEGELGMTFPEWNGTAITTMDFEKLIWNRLDFGADGTTPKWNTEELTSFVKWHLKSAPHHNYAVGAAWVTKKAL